MPRRAPTWLMPHPQTRPSKSRKHSVSCELGLKETTEPTGGTQHREYGGGPTNTIQPPRCSVLFFEPRLVRASFGFGDFCGQFPQTKKAPRLQPPSPPPLRSGGLPLWATALSPEPGPRGRTQPRPAKPAPALSLPTTKMTPERNISCTQPSQQPNAGGARDAQTPTPPAACDGNALSAQWNLGSSNLTCLT